MQQAGRSQRNRKLVIGIVTLAVVGVGGVSCQQHSVPEQKPAAAPATSPDPPKSGASGDRAQAEALVAEAGQQMQAGDTSKALQFLGQAHVADGTWVRPLLLRAQVYAAMHREQEAASDIEAAYRLDPSDPEPGLLLLRNMLPTKRAEEYEKIARHVLELRPTSGEAHFLLAQTILHSGDSSRYPEAMKEFEEAHRLAPRQALVLIEMGKLANLMGDHQLAITHLLSAADQVAANKQTTSPLDMATQRRNIAFELANAYQSLGRPADKKSWSDRAARLSSRLRDVEALRWKATAKPPDEVAKKQLDRLLSDPKFVEW